MKKLMIGIFALVMCFSSFKGMAQSEEELNALYNSDYYIQLTKVFEISNSNILSKTLLNDANSNSHLFSIAYDLDNNKEIDAELYVVSIDNGKSFEMIYKKYVSNDVVSFYNYKGVKALELIRSNGKIVINDEYPQELFNEIVEISSKGYWSCVIKRYQQLKKACESNTECDSQCDMLPTCHQTMMVAAIIKCL